MGTTTPSGRTRVPTMGDEPDIPADMMNMAVDLEAQIQAPWRFFSGIVTTNASGDASATIGVMNPAGTFSALPFPNQLRAAFIQDSTALGTPAFIIKWTSSSSSASTVTFRVFNASGAAVASTALAVSVFAIGR